MHYAIAENHKTLLKSIVTQGGIQTVLVTLVRLENSILLLYQLYKLIHMLNIIPILKIPVGWYGGTVEYLQ